VIGDIRNYERKVVDQFHSSLCWFYPHVAFF